MTKKEYDKLIDDHYTKQAVEHGKSKNSTMPDDTIRDKETNIIKEVLATYCRAKSNSRDSAGESADETRRQNPLIKVIDVGCGNGYTIDQLQNDDSLNAQYLGIEKNAKLRTVAIDAFLNVENVVIESGDIRSPDFATGKYDVLICQRVLINLLSAEDQKTALGNLVEVVKNDGLLIFCEAFQSGLDRLNLAREEFGLDPIDPAYHNEYLPDDFFSRDELVPYLDDNSDLPLSNFSSTHYYVSRVLRPVFEKALNLPFKRNTEFAKFFSSTLPDAEELYSPLQFRVFRKRDTAPTTPAHQKI